jgi:DtxR family Mn-dependent transcriptional regulator
MTDVHQPDSEKKLRDLRTEAVEDFLKTVYVLEKQIVPVPTTLLAQALNIAAPSVTDMIKRLSNADGEPSMPVFLEYTRYKGVTLTPLGQKIALEVIRHHRLLELYLAEALGYSWDQVHAEADRLEHHISEQLEARIAEYLGNPELDPHGDPIPALDGTLPDTDWLLLSDLEIGQRGVVSRITDQSPDLLRYFSDLGLVPGTQVQMLERAPLGDTVSLNISVADGPQKEKTISMQVARKVLVTAD